MNKKILFTLVFVLLLISGCTYKQAINTSMQDEQANNTSNEAENVKTGGMTVADALEYKDLSPEESKILIDENPRLNIIDVSPVYDQGHLPGALSYYTGDGSLDAVIPTLDKNETYLVYCHAESASRAGAQKLIDAGFENVYRLDGDYNAWVEAGYPVEN